MSRREISPTSARRITLIPPKCSYSQNNTTEKTGKILH